MDANPRESWFRKYTLIARAWYATLYTATMLAGYLAGCSLIWCWAYGFVQRNSEICRGTLGVEQVGASYHDLGSYGFGCVHLESGVVTLGSPSFGCWCYLNGVAGTLAAMWIAVFIALTLADLFYIRLRGPDQHELRVIWRNIRRDAVAVIGRPFTLGIVFLLMASIPVTLDITMKLDRLVSNDAAEWIRFVESGVPTALLVMTVLPFAAVLIETRRLAKRVSRLSRWCWRCGYRLDGNPDWSGVGARCPECGEEKFVDGLPSGSTAPLLSRRAAAILLIGFGLLLAANYWQQEIRLALIRLVSPQYGTWVAIVRVGGAVRLERPGETIWLRVEQPKRSRSRQLVEKFWPTLDHVEMRTIADPHGNPAAGQSGAAPRMLKRLDCFNAYPHRMVQNSSKISPGAANGQVQPMSVWSEWYPQSNIVWVYLSSADATSIRAADPATVPPFK